MSFLEVETFFIAVIRLHSLQKHPPRTSAVFKKQKKGIAEFVSHVACNVLRHTCNSDTTLFLNWAEH